MSRIRAREKLLSSEWVKIHVLIKTKTYAILYKRCISCLIKYGGLIYIGLVLIEPWGWSKQLIEPRGWTQVLIEPWGWTQILIEPWGTCLCSTLRPWQDKPDFFFIFKAIPTNVWRCQLSTNHRAALSIGATLPLSSLSLYPLGN